MNYSGRWAIRPATPDLIGKTALVGTTPDDNTILGMVVEVEGLIVTIRDELGDLHTIDTSDGRHIWVRA